MHESFEARWRRARSLENSGEARAAYDVYSAILAEEPHRLYVLLRMSDLEEGFDNYNLACDYALRAAQCVRQGRWGDLGAVSRRLFGLNQIEAMHRLILEADWKRPEVVKDAGTLAQHLYLINDVERALDLIDGALCQSPGDPRLHYVRATALRYGGRMREATDEYEKCIRLRPNYAHAHWALAYHEKADPPMARIERIQEALNRGGSAPSEKAYLHYALFKEYDGAGDVERAWDSLQRGMTAKKSSISYDAQAERAGFAYLTQRFGEAWFRPEPWPAYGLTPIFIVGMPRTGTTVLERILSNHQQVASAGELRDFNSALSEEADSFVEAAPRLSWKARLEGVDFDQVGRRYLRRVERYAAGKPFLIDKNPMNFALSGYVALALPQAKIICLDRSAMDTCFSNMKELFAADVYGYSYGQDDLAEYYGRFAALKEVWRERMPGIFLEVSYETLVADPIPTAERIAEFCGIEFDPTAVDITANPSPTTTASSSQVRQPIHSRGIGAWRRYAQYLAPLRTKLGL